MHLHLELANGTTEKYVVPEGKSLNDAHKDFWDRTGDFGRDWIPVGNERWIRYDQVIAFKRVS